jgi:hypothetical protein
VRRHRGRGQIEPRAEPAAGSGEDDHPAGGVGGDVVEEFVQCRQQRDVERIEAFGTVEGQHRQCVVGPFDE